jgi:hypothetical protein
MKDEGGVSEIAVGLTRILIKKRRKGVGLRRYRGTFRAALVDVSDPGDCMLCILGDETEISEEKELRFLSCGHRTQAPHTTWRRWMSLGIQLREVVLGRPVF